MAIISTGQITIVDNNDARPITGFISATPGTQQIYTKDESTTAFTPDWTTANTNTGLLLQAKFYAGGTTAATDITGALSNKKWSLDLSTALATGAASTTYFEAGGTLTVTNDTTQAKLNVKANLKAGNAPLVIYFEGDYTDPITGLVSHCVASITLSQVKTGTNSVFVQVNAPEGDALEPGSGKTQIRLLANLIRAAGVDDTGVTYRWFQYPHAAADQIDGNLASVTSKYGLLTTAQVAANNLGTIGQFNSAAITTTNMPDAAFGDYKGLVVHNSAVTDIGIYKVEAKDADGTIYQSFFTVYDIADPYDIKLVSTAGDKLQNGVGSTDVYPQLYYGATKVTDTSTVTYTWTFYDRNGSRGAFVDSTRTALAGGRSITANTTTVFTYSGTAITFAAGDIIKAIVNGAAKYYEVASGTGNTVTIRTPVTNAWLPTNTLTASEFLNGNLFVCVGSRTTTGANNNDAAAKITLSGDDIDAKGVVLCSADKP